MDRSDTQRTSPLLRVARGVWLILMKAVLPIAVLAAAGYGAKVMIDTAPKSQKRPPERQAKLVEVTDFEIAPRSLVLEAMGTVMAAREIELNPQVPGRVEWISDRLIPGGRFEADEPILQIEKRDYELAVDQAESTLRMARADIAQARARLTLAERDLRLEIGNQSVALRDFELLEGQIPEDSTDLILRKPQLEAAQAEVEAASAGVAGAEAALDAARARLESANLNLHRATVRAPFDLVVVSKQVDVGETVGTNSPLMRLIGSEEFWVELAIPQSDLQWIRIPRRDGEEGSEVRIHNGSAWHPSQFRTGQVIRQLPFVDERGRMARLLVSIEDPLALRTPDPAVPALLVGSYVRAEVVGQKIDSIITLPREFVHNGREAWVMTPDNRLAIRDLDILYRTRDEVLVRGGLAAGERIVTSELPAPVEGMMLRLQSEGSADVAQRPTGTPPTQGQEISGT